MNAGAVLFIYSNILKNAGIGFLVSRKYGNAVERNLFKRRCRALYKNFNFKNKRTSVIIRPLIKNVSYAKLNGDFKKLLEAFLS